MKNRVVAVLLLTVLLASIAVAALADDDYRASSTRFRNGKAYTIYASPSTEARVVGTLPSRTVFTIAFFTSIDGAAWACIILDDGTSGFISSGGTTVANLRMLDK